MRSVSPMTATESKAQLSAPSRSDGREGHTPTGGPCFIRPQSGDALTTRAEERRKGLGLPPTPSLRPIAPDAFDTPRHHGAKVMGRGRHGIRSCTAPSTPPSTSAMSIVASLGATSGRRK